MQRILTWWISLLPLVTLGQPLTQGERDRILSELHASRKLFLDSLAGLTPEQLNFKPAPDRWSIRDVAEHLILTEDFLFETITQKLLQSTPQPEKATEEQKKKDNLVLERLLDRSEKAQAPSNLQPSGRWKTPEELSAAFKERRDRTLAWVRETQAPLRHYLAPFPGLGELDAYQWLLVIAGHTERHVEQIREIQQAPGYPK